MTVRWVRLGPDEDPTRAVERASSSIDMVLGGPVSSHARLAIRGRLAPFVQGETPPWRAIEASTPPASSPIAKLGQDPDTAQGVSLIQGSPRAEIAHALLGALEETKPAAVVPSLKSVLYEATISDALPELHAAESAVRDRDFPAKQVGWMKAPPPWPPAAITRMRTKRDGIALIGTLAGQVAPNPAKKAVLMELFDRVPKPIDDELLLELDQSGLAADSRFRSWIRSEWSAWARQRYRRVLRNLTEQERTSG